MARGGKRPGAGRPKGSVSKATAEARGRLRDLAQQYTKEALEALVSVLRSDDAPAAAKVSAATALLDRGHGKPVQEIEHGGKDGGPIPVQFVAPDQYDEDEWESRQQSSG